MSLSWVRSAARTKVPLAWLSLVHRRSHLFAALGGVAFASTLMFLEMGFRNGLYDSHTYVVRMFNADLIIVHGQKEAVVPKLPFSRRRPACSGCSPSRKNGSNRPSER